jgi:steroid 5-alpha reductase family enzyme
MPTLFGVMWRLHPSATKNLRGDVAIALSVIWGIRLTQSYFRREEWKFGEREDWRYTKMAIDFGRPLWYAISFIMVGVA